MGEVLNWDADAAGYVRSRPDRYPGGLSIQPEWAQEVLNDPDLAALEPDPKPRMGASRFIGNSTSAGRTLTVIAFRDEDGELHLINVWPATGADVRIYREETNRGHDDGS